MKAIAEHHERLWRIVISPSIWAAHFLTSYLTAAIWCEKFSPHDGSLGPVPWLIAGYTALALAGIAWNGRDGWRRHRLEGSDPPHDDDTPEDRFRFLGRATVLLAGLSAVAVIFASLVILFFNTCR